MPNPHVKKVLKGNPKLVGKGSPFDTPVVKAKGSALPSYVKCCVCGKPPIEADWLKPVSPDPRCRKFVHLSHIQNGPGVNREAGFILRNA